MLSAEQLDILRNALELVLDRNTNAWPVYDIKYLCQRYDRLSYFETASGNDAFNRLLIQPKLMSLSPDGQWCKLTDYGRELYEEAEAH